MDSSETTPSDPDLRIDLKHVLALLDSHDWTRQKEGRLQAEQLSISELRLLADLEERHYRQERACQKRDMGIALSLFLTPIGYWAFRRSIDNSGHPLLLFYLLLGGLLVYFVLPNPIAFLAPASRARQNLASLLLASEEPQLVPYILSMLQDATTGIAFANAGTFRRLNPVLIQALVKLLPRLQEGDADSWTDEHKQILNDLLSEPTWNIELSLVILKALEEIGEGWCLYAVERLAMLGVDHGEIPILGGNPLQTWEDWRQRNDVTLHQLEQKESLLSLAARQCLPQILHRIEGMKQAASLLRPSDIQERDEGKSLLRAAPKAEEDPPEQPLRPR